MSGFRLIKAEAEERKVELGDPGRFALLSEAGAVLRTIRGEEDAPQAHPATWVPPFPSLPFLAGGPPPVSGRSPVVRFLVGSGPGEEDWTPSLPGRAGYIQLPQHLFWIAGGGEGPPESLDGFFWSLRTERTSPFSSPWDCGRTGPGSVSFPFRPCPFQRRGMGQHARQDQGKDFKSFLPGAELENLYALEAGAEALKLAMPLLVSGCHPGCLAQGVQARRSRRIQTRRPGCRRIVMKEG